jgi:hypothetical protein
VVVLVNGLLEVAWIQVLTGIETFLFNATSRLGPPNMLLNYDGPKHILNMCHSLQAKNIFHRVKHTRDLRKRPSDPVSFVLFGGHGGYAP